VITLDLSGISKDIDEIGAKLYLYPIGFCDAATIELGGKYAIFLDIQRFSTVTEMSWALAHEVAHCATGCTHKLSSPYDLIEKHEYKANRYVIEKYLPAKDLQRAMHTGYTTVYELSQYFDVPEDAIQKALYYWTECRGVDFNRM